MYTWCMSSHSDSNQTQNSFQFVGHTRMRLGRASPESQRKCHSDRKKKERSHEPAVEESEEGDGPRENVGQRVQRLAVVIARPEREDRHLGHHQAEVDVDRDVDPLEDGHHRLLGEPGPRRGGAARVVRHPLHTHTPTAIPFFS